METKSTTVELVDPNAEADAKEGDVRALFATLNEIDHDNDVTLPGAFKSGAPVRIAQYGHQTMMPPAGDGKIFADDERAVMKGHFYLDTTHGKDNYLTVKHQSEAKLQEWSYEYDVEDAEMGNHHGQPVRFLKALKVHGVTPVYLGAGIGTETLDIKGYTDAGEEIIRIVESFVNRTKGRAAFRAKEGRTLSSANRNRLNALVATIETTRDEIVKLLEETDPEKAKSELDSLYLDFLASEAKINGVLVN